MMNKNPDAIILLSGGTVSYKDEKTGEVKYRSTSYDEGDAFGVLGNIGRLEAVAYLAKEYPNALVVTTTKRNPGEPTHAFINKEELVELGVKRERIILEENSINSFTEIAEIFKLIIKNNWKKLALVTSDYHTERVQAMIDFFDNYLLDDKEAHEAHKELKSKNIILEVISAEKIIMKHKPEFEKELEEIKNKASFKLRQQSEAKGTEMIKNGTYGKTETRPEDKLERTV
jgi:hypothetical protein